MSNPYTIPVGATISINTVANTGANTISHKPLRVSDNEITTADLKTEVYNAKVEDLVNLWVARFGNEWTDLVDIEREEFFRHAYARLRQLGELEQHYLTDRSRFVCRKPE